MTRPWLRSFRKAARAALACTLGFALAGPASATWSIVVLNRDTGEVAVATSTCINSFDISRFVPVVRVGVAAGASQSFVDPIGRNKNRIFATSTREGWTPANMLAFIQTADGGIQNRQFGIVGFSGPPVTFSGSSNFDYAGGVTGQVGPYDYAIQGNILTGANVVTDCEAAFLGTVGDLGEKMMAAMEAARDGGGDGRCSCTTGSATSCGSPPPSFNFASYNAYMVIARLGDVDSPFCNGNNGSCVGGDYYLELNVVSNSSGPEPVAELRQLYDDWRADQVGRPDHVLTEVTQTMPRLRADGVTRSSVTVRLRDVDGNAITSGGHAIGVNAKSGMGNIVTVEDVTDNGDGTYTFDFQATQMTGEAEYVVVIDDGIRPVEMYPSLQLTSVAPEELHLGLEEIRISEATSLPILVDLGAAASPSPYRILGSVSGTAPSTLFGGVSVPLVRDRFFDFTETWAGGEPFVNNVGSLDASGRAQARLDFPAGALTSLAGATMYFSAWSSFSNLPATPAQGVPIVP